MKINLWNAIFAIKSNAKMSYSNEDINTLVWYDNNPTGITNQQILAKQKELQAEEDNRITQQEANKQSALNKLKALGLNDAEIKSIIG
jgi:hypothetical protein